MAVTVRVPGPLRHLAGNHAKVSVEGRTVAQVLSSLHDRFPALRDHVLDTSGEQLPFINIYRNQSDIRFDGGLHGPLDDNDELSIIPAIAGGAGAADRGQPAAPRS